MRILMRGWCEKNIKEKEHKRIECGDTHIQTQKPEKNITSACVLSQLYRNK